MKSLLIGASVVLVFTIAACKRSPSSSAATTAATTTTANDAAKAEAAREAEESNRKRISEALESAKKAFDKRDIAEALKILNKVPDALRTDPEYLTLRGACHVEKRDFGAAFEDFQKAAKKNPGEPSIQFNIGEVYFVTDRWDEAIKEFQLVKPKPGADGEALQALIDFKIMLCEEGRGNAKEFDRLAAANLAKAGTLLAAYTKAAMEFRDGRKTEAKATLADAAKKLPKPSDRAPWYDTMIEFGYDPR